MIDIADGIAPKIEGRDCCCNFGLIQVALFPLKPRGPIGARIEGCAAFGPVGIRPTGLGKEPGVGERAPPSAWPARTEGSDGKLVGPEVGESIGCDFGFECGVLHDGKALETEALGEPVGRNGGPNRAISGLGAPEASW